MAVRGTGLPLPESDAILQPTAGIEPITTAAEWGRIAESAGRLANIGVSIAERETNKAQTGYLADLENNIVRKRIELRDQYSKDPQGFDKEWKAYTDGTLGAVEPWAVPHARKALGSNGNQGYSATLAERRSEDERLDKQRLNALLETSRNEVIGSAMAGTLGSAEGIERSVKFKHVLDTAVNNGFITREEADLKIKELTDRSGAETAIRAIGETYRQNRLRGLEAGDIAMKEAEEQILRNPALDGLSEEQRYSYFNRAKTEIRALEAERRADLAAAKQRSAQVQAILKHTDVDESTIGEIEAELKAAGGFAEAAKLRAAAVRAPQLKAYGRMSLEGQDRNYGKMQTDNGVGLTGQVNSVIEEEARRTGIPASVIRRYIKIESGGNVNQVTGSYKGLLQLSDKEFQRYMPGGNIFDPVQNVRAGVAKIADEMDDFRKKYGRDPSASDLYLIHQQGAGGYDAHMRNPTAPAWMNMASTGEGRQKGEAWAKAAIWGNIPDKDKARFGSVENVTSADFVALWRRKVGDDNSADDLQLVVGQRKILNETARQEWRQILADLDTTRRYDPAKLDTIISAATKVDDHDLLEEIGRRMTRHEIGENFGQTSIAAQAGAIDELESQPTVQAGTAALIKDFEAIKKDTEQKLKDSPISLASERFPERFTPAAPLNLDDRNEMLGGLRDRASRADFVSQIYGEPRVSALSSSDVSTVAGAIAGPDPKRTANALDMLASLPDNNLIATLRQPDIKASVSAAALSTDPVKYLAAMSAIDKMWSRAPQEVAALFGDDVIKNLQDWQAKLRYTTPEDLATQLQRRDDPGVIEQRKKLEREADTLIRKRTVSDLLGDLDPPGFNNKPTAPVDSRTADMAMADYATIFAERYAVTRDQSKAHEQTVERMKIYWSSSAVNGGRLTLYPPEARYPQVNGSHQWMRDQLVRDVAETIGAVPDDVSIIADRQTQVDIDSGRRPSYLIQYKDKSGMWQPIRDERMQMRRYQWDPGPVKESAAAEFTRQRERFQGAQSRAQEINAAVVNTPLFEGFGYKGPSLADLGFGPDSVMQPARDAANAKDPLKRFTGEASRRLREGGSLVNRGQ